MKHTKRILVFIGGVLGGVIGFIKGHPEFASAGLAVAGWAVPFLGDLRIQALVRSLFVAPRNDDTAATRVVPIEQAPTLSRREKEVLSRLRRASKSPPVETFAERRP